MLIHIIEIVVMLLIAALLGFLIAWFWKKNKDSETNGDVSSLEDKIKQLQRENENLQKDKLQTEKLLAECRGDLTETDAALKKEHETLERVKAKAKNIDFTRIGTAREDEKQDLKTIWGIGPFIEKKLNALGIFTFKQIANFNDEDKNKVNEAIEFFPGRIERDDWVEQAKKLSE